MKELTTILTTVSSAITLLINTAKLLPSSPERKAALLALQQAEQAIQEANVRLADDLEYNLCKCTFPPQIALRTKTGEMRCPSCRRDTNEDYESRRVVFGR